MEIKKYTKRECHYYSECKNTLTFIDNNGQLYDKFDEKTNWCAGHYGHTVCADCWEEESKYLKKLKEGK